MATTKGNTRLIDMLKDVSDKQIKDIKKLLSTKFELPIDHYIYDEMLEELYLSTTTQHAKDFSENVVKAFEIVLKRDPDASFVQRDHYGEHYIDSDRFFSTLNWFKRGNVNKGKAKSLRLRQQINEAKNDKVKQINRDAGRTVVINVAGKITNAKRLNKRIAREREEQLRKNSTLSKQTQKKLRRREVASTKSNKPSSFYVSDVPIRVRMKFKKDADVYRKYLITYKDGKRISISPYELHQQTIDDMSQLDQIYNYSKKQVANTGTFGKYKKNQRHKNKIRVGGISFDTKFTSLATEREKLDLLLNNLSYVSFYEDFIEQNKQLLTEDEIVKLKSDSKADQVDKTLFYTGFNIHDVDLKEYKTYDISSKNNFCGWRAMNYFLLKNNKRAINYEQFTPDVDLDVIKKTLEREGITLHILYNNRVYINKTRRSKIGEGAFISYNAIVGPDKRVGGHFNIMDDKVDQKILKQVNSDPKKKADTDSDGGKKPKGQESSKKEDKHKGNNSNDKPKATSKLLDNILDGTSGIEREVFTIMFCHRIRFDDFWFKYQTNCIKFDYKVEHKAIGSLFPKDINSKVEYIISPCVMNTSYYGDWVAHRETGSNTVDYYCHGTKQQLEFNPIGRVIKYGKDNFEAVYKFMYKKQSIYLYKKTTKPVVNYKQQVIDVTLHNYNWFTGSDSTTTVKCAVDELHVACYPSTRNVTNHFETTTNYYSSLIDVSDFSLHLPSKIFSSYELRLNCMIWERCRSISNTKSKIHENEKSVNQEYLDGLDKSWFHKIISFLKGLLKSIMNKISNISTGFNLKNFYSTEHAGITIHTTGEFKNKTISSLRDSVFKLLGMKFINSGQNMTEQVMFEEFIKTLLFIFTGPLSGVIFGACEFINKMIDDFSMSTFKQSIIPFLMHCFTGICPPLFGICHYYYNHYVYCYIYRGGRNSEYDAFVREWNNGFMDYSKLKKLNGANIGLLPVISQSGNLGKRLLDKEHFYGDNQNRQTGSPCILAVPCLISSKSNNADKNYENRDLYRKMCYDNLKTKLPSERLLQFQKEYVELMKECEVTYGDVRGQDVKKVTKEDYIDYFKQLKCRNVDSFNQLKKEVLQYEREKQQMGVLKYQYFKIKMRDTDVLYDQIYNTLKDYDYSKIKAIGIFRKQELKSMKTRTYKIKHKGDWITTILYHREAIRDDTVPNIYYRHEGCEYMLTKDNYDSLGNYEVDWIVGDKAHSRKIDNASKFFNTWMGPLVANCARKFKSRRYRKVVRKMKDRDTAYDLELYNLFMSGISDDDKELITNEVFDQFLSDDFTIGEKPKQIKISSEAGDDGTLDSFTNVPNLAVNYHLLTNKVYFNTIGNDVTKSDDHIIRELLEFFLIEEGILEILTASERDILLNTCGTNNVSDRYYHDKIDNIKHKVTMHLGWTFGSGFSGTGFLTFLYWMCVRSFFILKGFEPRDWNHYLIEYGINAKMTFDEGEVASNTLTSKAFIHPNFASLCKMSRVLLPLDKDLKASPKMRMFFVSSINWVKMGMSSKLKEDILVHFNSVYEYFAACMYGRTFQRLPAEVHDLITNYFLRLPKFNLKLDQVKKDLPYVLEYMINEGLPLVPKSPMPKQFTSLIYAYDRCDTLLNDFTYIQQMPIHTMVFSKLMFRLLNKHYGTNLPEDICYYPHVEIKELPTSVSPNYLGDTGTLQGNNSREMDIDNSIPSPPIIPVTTDPFQVDLSLPDEDVYDDDCYASLDLPDLPIFQSENNIFYNNESRDLQSELEFLTTQLDIVNYELDHSFVTFTDSYAQYRNDLIDAIEEIRRIMNERDVSIPINNYIIDDEDEICMSLSQEDECSPTLEPKDTIDPKILCNLEGNKFDDEIIEEIKECVNSIDNLDIEDSMLCDLEDLDKWQDYCNKTRDDLHSADFLEQRNFNMVRKNKEKKAKRELDHIQQDCDKTRRQLNNLSKVPSSRRVKTANNIPVNEDLTRAMDQVDEIENNSLTIIDPEKAIDEGKMVIPTTGEAKVTTVGTKAVYPLNVPINGTSEAVAVIEQSTDKRAPMGFHGCFLMGIPTSNGNIPALLSAELLFGDRGESIEKTGGVRNQSSTATVLEGQALKFFPTLRSKIDDIVNLTSDQGVRDFLEQRPLPIKDLTGDPTSDGNYMYIANFVPGGNNIELKGKVIIDRPFTADDLVKIIGYSAAGVKNTIHTYTPTVGSNFLELDQIFQVTGPRHRVAFEFENTGTLSTNIAYKIVSMSLEMISGNISRTYQQYVENLENNAWQMCYQPNPYEKSTQVCNKFNARQNVQEFVEGAVITSCNYGSGVIPLTPTKAELTALSMKSVTYSETNLGFSAVGIFARRSNILTSAKQYEIEQQIKYHFLSLPNSIFQNQNSVEYSLQMILGMMALSNSPYTNPKTPAGVAYLGLSTELLGEERYDLSMSMPPSCCNNFGTKIAHQVHKILSKSAVKARSMTDFLNKSVHFAINHKQDIVNGIRFVERAVESIEGLTVLVAA